MSISGAVKGFDRAPYRDQVIMLLIKRGLSENLSEKEEAKIKRVARFLPAETCAHEIEQARGWQMLTPPGEQQQAHRERGMPYDTIYKNDRRQHHHRCQCCRKIIEVGAPVVMWRLGKITRALHAECQDTIAIDNITHRQLAELHVTAKKEGRI